MRHRGGSVHFLPQILRDQFDERAAGASKQERIFRTSPVFRNDDQVLREELRFAGNRRAVQIDRLGKRFPIFSTDEHDLVRLFVRSHDRAKYIRRKAAAATADAGHSPGDRFAEKILFTENRREA